MLLGPRIAPIPDTMANQLMRLLCRFPGGGWQRLSAWLFRAPFVLVALTCGTEVYFLGAHSFGLIHFSFPRPFCPQSSSMSFRPLTKQPSYLPQLVSLCIPTPRHFSGQLDARGHLCKLCPIRLSLIAIFLNHSRMGLHHSHVHFGFNPRTKGGGE